MSGAASQPAPAGDTVSQGAGQQGYGQLGPVALVGSGEFLDVMVEVDRGLLAGRPAKGRLPPDGGSRGG